MPNRGRASAPRANEPVDVQMRREQSIIQRSPIDGPLLTRQADDRPAGQAIVFEGSGRFVGDPPTGATSSADAGPDGVTVNLVNVPASQAAKAILGDMLSVKYSVDPTIDGRVTIQTPKPVTRLAALDLFQTALRSNNAIIVNKGDSPARSDCQTLPPMGEGAFG